MGKDMEKTEYAIKQVGDRYYPVIIDREAGGHYEIRNPLIGSILMYSSPQAAETHIKRAREKGKGSPIRVSSRPLTALSLVDLRVRA